MGAVVASPGLVCEHSLTIASWTVDCRKIGLLFLWLDNTHFVFCEQTSYHNNNAASLLTYSLCSHGFCVYTRARARAAVITNPSFRAFLVQFYLRVMMSILLEKLLVRGPVVYLPEEPVCNTLSL